MYETETTKTDNPWQAERIVETWERAGIKVESSRLKYNDNPESCFGSFTSDEAAKDLDLSAYDTPEDMLKDGWVVVETKMTVAELMPSETYHSLTDEILKLIPVLPEPDPEAEAREVKIRGLIKRLGHIEKHSVYQRLDMYFKEYLPESGREFLRLKVETHRDMSRLPVEQLGSRGY